MYSNVKRSQYIMITKTCNTILQQCTVRKSVYLKGHFQKVILYI